jgi:type II secretory pathway pseudopilin PulG
MVKYPTEAGAFTTIEVLMALAIAGVVFMAFYAGLSFGFRTVRVTRENLRATQVMMEKLEAIRLCSWEQLTNTQFIPRTFTNTYFPNGTNSSGAVYYGQVIFTNVPISSSYSNDMTNVIVRIGWTNGTKVQSREMHTFVARRGAQRYIYGRQ